MPVVDLEDTEPEVSANAATHLIDSTPFLLNKSVVGTRSESAGAKLVNDRGGHQSHESERDELLGFAPGSLDRILTVIGLLT